MGDAATGATTPSGAHAGRVADAWDRWWWLWDIAFYLLLAVALGLALVDGDMAGWRRGAAVALALVFAAWHWGLVAHSPARRHNQHLMLIYVAGAFALCAALVWLHPIFNLLLFSLYSQLYGLLPLRRAIPATLVLSVGVAWPALRDGDTETRSTVLLMLGIGVALGGVLAFWIGAIISQSYERQRLIEELQATRRELAAAEREAGVLSERQRLAGEIHDTLAQGFVSVVMHLEAAEGALDRLAAPDAAALRRHLDDARRTARENLAEARRLVWALRPELLRGGTLAEAIERVVGRWSDDAEIVADFTVTGSPRQLPAECEVTLLRAAQEALANIRKHAAAARVAVTLTYLDDATILDVQDDGRGFDPLVDQLHVTPGAEGGFGLRAMRERVAALGGALTIESAPGEGTTLAVELPTAGAAVGAGERVNV